MTRDLDPSIVRKIMRGNAIELYGLEARGLS
jgi:hypothetical protein